MSDVKPVKLTKKGVPDKRAETSKKNLEKGKNIIKQALKESKIKKPVIMESSDEETDDDEECEFELKPVVGNQGSPTTPPTTALAFPVEVEVEDEIEDEPEPEPEVLVKPKKKGKSKEMIASLFNEIQTLRQSNDEVKSILSKQQSDFNRRKLNTHIGILNQEMLLKF
jgi:hypothetical protein